MSKDIKLSKAQLSKIIQIGGFFRNMLDNLGKKVITNLARDSLPGLVRNLASNAVNKFERKISEKRSYESRKKI